MFKKKVITPGSPFKSYYAFPYFASIPGQQLQKQRINKISWILLLVWIVGYLTGRGLTLKGKSATCKVHVVQTISVKAKVRRYWDFNVFGSEGIRCREADRRWFDLRASVSKQLFCSIEHVYSKFRLRSHRKWFDIWAKRAILAICVDYFQILQKYSTVMC